MKKQTSKLLTLINQNEKIKRYKHLEKIINNNDEIMSLLEQIKEAQQQMVNANHIENKSIYNKYKERHDRLYEQIDNIPLLNEYLALQGEINEVLSYITETIEDGIEKELLKEAKNQ